MSETDAPEPGGARAPVGERRREDRMPRWVPRAMVLFFALFLAYGLVRHLFDRLQNLLLVLLVSVFLSLAVEPIVNRLAARGWRRGTATGLVLAAVTAATLVFLVALGTLVVQQVSNLVDRAPAYIEDIEDFLNRNLGTNLSADDLIAQLQQGSSGELGSVAGGVAGTTLRLTGTALSFLLSALSVALFTFYLVADGPRLRRAICSVLPPERQREVMRIWELAIDKTGGYLYSRALLALLSTVAHWVALTVIGVPSSLALALWVGLVSQFLPVIGTYLAGVLPIFVALVDEPISALWVLVFVVVYQQIENYLFAPRITARTMNIHPALAFGAALAGAAVLGPVGAILALPTAASVQALVSIYVTRHDVVETELTAAVPAEPVAAAQRTGWWRRIRIRGVRPTQEAGR